ncbi:MAG TPA: leucine--tRNA ligase [Candidatus Didemnitutus sp.]|nr:leucine--tRNA ligase [Candidatus Didemnitutus sp.]
MSATNCKDYEFLKIEPHWQTIWEKTKAFRADNASAQQKYYVLDMFPYPSGAGLHLGHCENYTITDVMARYKRARGFNVLYPIGWDAFGLPTENYAVKTGRHPAEVTKENIATFRRQLKSIGVSYDFDREINTTEPKYFRWTQWIWLQLFKRGLAYVQDKPVWWCPALGTVLANEEVIDGKSEVGNHPVERRPVRQWVLRITAYADRLLEDLKGLDWPDSTKRMQEAWIGRSEGCEVDFALDGLPGEKLRVFTTRVDTLFGATYMVVAPEHPLVAKLTTPAQRPAVDAYVKQTASRSEVERMAETKEKTGVFSGTYAVNPANGAKIPVWIADYVLMGYGTGAIMAVPAQDERDWDFAKAFNLPIIRTVQPPADFPDKAFTGDGVAINSANAEVSLNGLGVDDANRKMSEWVEGKGLGVRRVNFKLRDWLFSRQRYWGEPFPIVWVSEADYRTATAAQAARLPIPKDPVTCVIDGATVYGLPLPESALPLSLPEVTSYQPTGTGESPLAAITDWLEIWYNPATGEAKPASQPSPGPGWVRGRRETNTMPQWAGSCWYYLRYLEPDNNTAIVSKEALKYWGVPDIYVGGAEHSVLHLLYARFWHKVLFDIGVVPMAEPFPKLFHQGIILGEDGEKMSKSRGNVANPDEVITQYGSDTLRLYLMFLGPLEAMKRWNPKGIEGVHRFLKKLWRECLDENGAVHPRVSDSATLTPATEKILHETIKKVGEDIDGLRYNTAISQLMILLNALQKEPALPRAVALDFLRLVAPLAPHIAEELWTRLGQTGLVAAAGWPKFDPAKLVADTITIVFQVNGKHRGDIQVAPSVTEADLVKLAYDHPKVAPHLAGKPLKRSIYVKGKLINLLV